MKKTKLLVLILSLALLVSGIVGISASAEDADPTVAIEGKNISYMEVSTLVVAVSYENADLADVKLNVWYGEKAGDPTVITTTETIEVNDKNCAMFVLDGTPAKNVADRVYYEAFVDGTEVKTALESYSVLEYALEGVVNSTDAAEAARYQSIITYATSIQEWLKADGKFDGTLAKDYSYVQIEGGTLDGTSVKGIYANGTTINLNADGVSNWDVNINGSSIIMAAGTTLTVSGNTKIKPSDPFETFENGEIPSTIQNSSTHPTQSSINSTKEIVTPSIKDNPNGSGKVLSLSPRYSSSRAILKISETSNAEAEADTVVFSTRLNLDWSSNSTSAEFFNLMLADANGNLAFNMVLRLNSTTGNIGLASRLSTGGLRDSGCTFKAGADGNWMDLKVVYSCDGTNTTVKVYCGEDLKATYTGDHTAGTVIDDSAITNAYIVVNGRAENSHTVNTEVYIDDLSFKHVVAD